MRIAFWISKATDTHSECVILCFSTATKVTRTRCTAGQLCGQFGITVLQQCPAEDRVSGSLQLLVVGRSKLSVSVACVSFSSGTGLNIWGFSTKNEPRNLH